MGLSGAPDVTSALKLHRVTLMTLTGLGLLMRHERSRWSSVRSCRNKHFVSLVEAASDPSCPSQWLETQPSRQQCPVCKAGISREKVIPLYGRGSSSQEDPRFAACVQSHWRGAWPLCDGLFVLQVENPTPATGAEDGAGEQRRGESALSHAFL